MEPNDPSLKSVGRSLTILEFLKKNGKANLTTIANGLSMSTSAVYRHLHTFEKEGYIIKSGNMFYLGLKFLDFGTHSKKLIPNYNLIKEKVDGIANQIDERVQFITHEYGQAVFVYQQSGPNAVEAGSYPGKRIPLHASAAGLAILSDLDEKEVKQIASSHGLSKITPETITSYKELDKELRKTRERGYSINSEGYTIGLSAVGTSIVDANGRPVGGLSISGPTNRMQDEQGKKQTISLLLGTANELELKIEYADS